MLVFSQEQLRNGVSTRKVATSMGMSQSSVAHLRKDVGEVTERQRGGHPKASYRLRKEVLCHSCY